MITECCQLDANTKNLKLENKDAIEKTISLMLDFVIAEKEICELVLCGQESTDKMLNNMDDEINKLSNIVNCKTNDNNIRYEAPNALENDVKLAENQTKTLTKEVDEMKYEISTKKGQLEKLMSETSSEEIDQLKHSIAAINRKIQYKKNID